MDCSKTIDFFAEAKRLCTSRTRCTTNAAYKEQCPLFGFCGRTIATRSAEEVIQAIKTVQKWSDEHPVKTYAQDFFEKFPEARPTADGVPRMCRVDCYGGSCRQPSIDANEMCKCCWNEEMKAADDE